MGELQAKNLLLNKGYQFLTANFRTRIGEIDLIFLDRQTVVFVEVKTRTSLDQGLPEEAVTPVKLRTIERVGEAFLIENNLENLLARIDVVAIEMVANKTEMRHLVGVTGW